VGTSALEIFAPLVRLPLDVQCVTKPSVRNLLQRVLSRSDRASSLVSQAEAAFGRGSITAARALLAEALASAPDDVALALAVAQLSISNGLRDDAVTIHRGLLQRSDPPRESTMVLAELAFAANAKDAAIDLVRRALDRHPTDLELARALALYLEKSGQLEAARDRAIDVCKRAPDDVDAHRIAGRVSGRLGEVTQCVDAWRRVVALTGHKEKESRTAYGIALSHAGRHDEAVRELSDVVVLHESASAHSNLGMALLEAGHTDSALAAFGRAIQLEGTNAQARLGAGLALLEAGRTAEAVRSLRAATQLAPSWDTAWYNLALALRADGELPEARRALVRAATLSPDDPEVQELLDELTAPPPPRAQRDSIEITGDLTSFPLPDLIEFLRSGAKTGTVVVAARLGAGLVRLDHGRITSANAPGTVRLGEMLMEANLVLKSDLDRLLLVQADRPDQSEKLGTLLLTHRLVEREALRRTMFKQTLSALEEILSWPEGSFSFHRNRELAAGLPEDEEPISFDAQHVMMELMRIIDERQIQKP